MNANQELNIKLNNITINTDPLDYIPSVPLVMAANLAYALKRPLLLSGEPGTGKTDFAKYVAMNLSGSGFSKEPLIFPTKSSSAAQDLFYQYDAVAHFRAQNKPADEFIELRALGKAFANAVGSANLRNVSAGIPTEGDKTTSPDKEKGRLSKAIMSEAILKKSGIAATPAGTVVLIDEIDKAPRDFPNDLLNEIERYYFDIRETGDCIELNEEQKKNVLIILTSNFEKNLPEAFLRRCVYFHIEFPDKEALKQIIIKRMGWKDDDTKITDLNNRIKEFFIIRDERPVQKKPSTIEMLDFVRALAFHNLLDKRLLDENGKVIAGSPIRAFLPILLKKKEDLQLFLSLG